MGKQTKPLVRYVAVSGATPLYSMGVSPNPLLIWKRLRDTTWTNQPLHHFIKMHKTYDGLAVRKASDSEAAKADKAEQRYYA